MVGPALME
ncbi:hypothetical protein pdam_00025885 [Pocillopora damicornis]|uniref:Uncharacterized protein n=1 Tax=Pocillopora damicornis TaxID=46731 RepID=A0A3M6U9V1_POCDA|nr:hypothetical protein pdam_00025885 [Pocillopora damicornis]